MITFRDGPATGVSLSLSRSPICLRVVRNAKGEWDALDQPADAAKPDEAIWLYRVIGIPSFAFIDGRDKNGKRFGRQTHIGEYRYDPVQPADAEMRNELLWKTWCAENTERIMDERKAELS